MKNTAVLQRVTVDGFITTFPFTQVNDMPILAFFKIISKKTISQIIHAVITLSSDVYRTIKQLLSH